MSDEIKKDETTEASESEVKEAAPAVEAPDEIKPAAPVQASEEAGAPVTRAPSAGGGRHGDSAPGDDQRRPMAPRVPRFKRKGCRFCQNKNLVVDYKNVEVLERFITDRGKILPRRITGTCSKHQRAISLSIKRARIVALLPFVVQ